MIRLVTEGSGLETFLSPNFTWPVISSTGGSSSLIVINHDVGKKPSLIHIEDVSSGYKLLGHYRHNSTASPSGTRRTGYRVDYIGTDRVDVRLYRWSGSAITVRMLIYFFDDEDVQ